MLVGIIILSKDMMSLWCFPNSFLVSQDNAPVLRKEATITKKKMTVRVAGAIKPVKTVIESNTPVIARMSIEVRYTASIDNLETNWERIRNSITPIVIQP